MTADSQTLAAAWEDYASKLRRLQRSGLETATVEQAIDVERAYQRFRVACASASEDTQPTMGTLVETIRSAHAMLHGVLNIGSFQQVTPDPCDHDASCTLIINAHELLDAALRASA